MACLASVDVARTEGTLATTESNYLILYNAWAVPEDVEQSLAAAGGTFVSSIDSVGLVWATSSDSGFAARVATDPNVSIVEDMSGVVVEFVGDEGAELEREDPGILQSFADIPAAVEALDPALKTPTVDDVFFPFQWNLQRINAPQAWTIHTGSHDTIAVVMDSGVASNHPDLAPNLVHRACFSGTSNPCPPYPDFVTGTGSFHGTALAGLIAAGFGGGPALSGSPLPPSSRTIGGGGMVGVAPNLGLASYKVGSDQGCADVQSCLALAFGTLQGWQDIRTRHAQGMPLDVISLSVVWITLRQVATPLFGASCSTVHALLQAMQRSLKLLDREGVTVVVAAGNQARNVLGPQSASELAINPFCYSSLDPDKRIILFSMAEWPSVITVGAVGIRPTATFANGTVVFAPVSDTLTDYSNFGAAVDLVAPSGHARQLCAEDYAPAPCPSPMPAIYRYHTLIYTGVQVVGGCAAAESCVTYTATGFSGTSGATPQVTAVAGLVIDKAKKNGVRLTPAQVKAILVQTARPLGDRQLYGHGLVDAYAALKKVDEMTRGSAQPPQ